jgi:hypothetical protein
VENIKLLIIDKDMCTVEIEVEKWLFRQLNINSDAVKKHTSKSALNKRLLIF